MNVLGNGRKLICALCQNPICTVLSVLALHVTMSEVDSKEVAGDMLVNILFLYVPALHANDNSHLNLVVDIFVHERVKF